MKSKVLIAIPLKQNDRSLVEPRNIVESMKSLLDVVSELQLESFSIGKTEHIDDMALHFETNEKTVYRNTG